MRTALSIILVSSLFAQDVKQGSWREVTAIKAGWKVEVVRLDRTKVKGEFVSASPDGIVIQDGSGAAAVARTGIRKVSAKPRNRLKHAAMGAGIGAGAGAGILGGVAAMGQREGADENWVPDFAALGAIIGAIPGVVLGIVAGGNRTVYELRTQ